MGNKLDLDSFNEILFNALKEGASKKELLEVELSCASDMLISAMAEVIDLLNDGKDYTEALKKCNNIKSNCEKLVEQLGIIDE